MVVSLIAGVAIERADRRRALMLGSALLAGVYIAYMFVSSANGA